MTMFCLAAADVALSRCRHHRSLRAAATVLPPSLIVIVGTAAAAAAGGGGINSLTAMVADMQPLFFELCASLITFPIFVR